MARKTNKAKCIEAVDALMNMVDVVLDVARDKFEEEPEAFEEVRATLAEGEQAVVTRIAAIAPEVVQRYLAARVPK